MSTATLPETISPRTAPVRGGLILAVVLAGVFMAILDVSIVNVAAPTMKRDLHASGAGLQLAVAGYTISYAVLLITGARIGDLIAHGRAFVIGVAGFTLASLACGLAPTMDALVAFRFVQGAAAALMMPQVLSVIQRTFDGPARVRAIGLYSAVIASAAVVGQVLGGVLVSADIAGTGWRPIFLVNVPIGAALFVAARRYLPFSTGSGQRHLDLAGVLTLSLCVLSLVVPLVLGHEEGWPAWCWALLAASPVLFGVFLLVERRVGQRGGRPLVSARVVRAPGILAGIGALFFGMATYGGYLFATALHLQNGLGDSPLRAGLIFVPAAAAFALIGTNWRRLPATWHAPIIPVGLLIAAVSCVGLDEVLHNGHQGGIELEVMLALLGLGLGLAFGPIFIVSLTHVPLADAADASGLLSTVTQLGQVVGIASIGTIYLSRTGPTVLTSARAISTADLALAVVALGGAVCGLILVQRRRAAALLAD